MRKISADYIYPISTPPIQNGIILIEDGVIIDVLGMKEGKKKTKDAYSEVPIEYYKGIICPGFINTHCHLELSNLRGKIINSTGLAGFIDDLIAKRIDSSPIEINQAIVDAEKEMLSNGIVAVGDISNGELTFIQKELGNLRYHTFIEVHSLNPEKSEESFNKGLLLSNKIKHQCSIIPHAPYTVSDKLMEKINLYLTHKKSILSIHNQESQAENDFFINKTGPLVDLYKKRGLDISFFKSTGNNSLKSTLVQLSKLNKILLVHNTYTSKEDIRWAQKYSKKICWCFCPKANLYIENRLPDFQSFLDENARVTIGTDSLASNSTLSILEELKTITQHAPQISMETLFTWATKNGAIFFDFDKEMGTIEKGKKPGLNWIKNIDLKAMRLTPESSIEKLI